MVLEIATGLTPLAMTVVVVTWSRFAVSAVVDLQCTAERHGGRSLHDEPKIRKKSPDSKESGDFHLKLFVPIRRAPERRGRRSLRSEFHTQSGN